MKSIKSVRTVQFQNLRVVDIELDCSNPRIRKFVEMYTQTPSREQLLLALGAAGDDQQDSSTTFEKLRNSILTNGGIIQPIIVNQRIDGTFLCIEGNTRVAIYKTFLDEKTGGQWTTIPALVYSDMTEQQIDAIRLQVHLVGTRPWDPYSKAKYLHYLRTQEMLPFNEIVDFCGGRTKDVMESINAYSDMEACYRPVVPDDGSFDTRKFSGFVELQKPGIKEALTKAGFTATDFARWIHEEKIYPLNTVRMLPRILANSRARDLFLKEGARAAVAVLDRPELTKQLQEADIPQLAQALAQKIYNLPWQKAERLLRDPSDPTMQEIYELLDALNQFLKSQGERS